MNKLIIEGKEVEDKRTCKSKGLGLSWMWHIENPLDLSIDESWIKVIEEDRDSD